MTPKVSIVLTAYNRAHSIGRTIESLLAQEFGDFELVISDDQSSDRTEEVCREYERLDGRVRYFRNERNLRMPGNLIAGIARTSAPYIANLHDGDVYRTELLATWKAALDKHADAAFVFNALDVLNESGSLVLRRVPDLPERLERGDLVRYMVSDMHCYNSPVWGTVMARRAAYDAVGGFDPRFSFIADVAMWLRLNLRYPVAYVAEPLIQLTPHESDRPYAYVNWGLERALTSMYDEAVEVLCDGDAINVARERNRLRRIRDRRWLWLAGSCVRRSRLDLAREALEIFRQEDSVRLWMVGYAGALIYKVPRLASLTATLFQGLDVVIRGRRS